ncbi:hypothetical protein [Aliivibrio fischeri]|uniref:hypothetical protein n=1 Tax=Aliivibrio fischeri TaxID=668 RepID=UPI0007C4B746|nr:hypothetical protein [Aliivibrio fischeri]
MKKLKKPVIVIAIFLVMLWCSVWFKNHLNLSEASLMVLVTLATIFSVLLPNLNELKSFSLAKGELILRDVKDKEQAVNELASATLELIEASPVPLLVEEEFDSNRYNEAIKKVKALTEKT